MFIWKVTFLLWALPIFDDTFVQTFAVNHIVALRMRGKVNLIFFIMRKSLLGMF